MKQMTVAARTAIDKTYRHFLRNKRTDVTRSDVVHFLHYCATKKSIIAEIEALRDEYINRHCIPTPEAVASAGAGFLITPQTKAIMDSNMKTSAKAEKLPVVKPIPKKRGEVVPGKTGMFLRFATEDIIKLRLIAAELNMSPQAYAIQLVLKHINSFEFGK